MRGTAPSRSRRPGVTLIEMLIVISIMLLLTAMAVPMVRLILVRRPIREAARSVSDYFASAQIRARETGRPAGVWIERFGSQPQSAFTLFQAEVPPPYGGSLADSAALSLAFDTTVSSTTFIVILLARFNADDVWRQLPAMAKRKAIKFRSTTKGPGTPSRVSPSRPFNWIPATARYGVALVRPHNGLPVQSSPYLPYQIIRQPMRSAVRPLQLPSTTVIDLYASGGSSVSFEANATTDRRDIVIMFSPNGGIDSAGYFDASGYTSLALTAEPIYLLIGQRGQIPGNYPGDSGYPASLADDGRLNWQDLNNLWVTVFPRNGLVTVAENASAGTIADARLYAQRGSEPGRTLT